MTVRDCAFTSNAVAQGQQLLWSTSDATLRLAILETVKRYSSPHDAHAALSQRSDDDDRRLLLGKEEDFS